MPEKVSAISVVANLVLAGGKISVGVFSNSAAILAEGMHSLMDILSSAIGYAGIKISKKPVDEGHPYGHYKFEVLAGLLITAILFATGATIVYEAYHGFLHPRKIILGYLALGVMVFSAMVNEIMARLKIYYGKKEDSISLLSDGVHSRVDVYTALGVFVGLLLTKYWVYADSSLACLIGLYIIKESFSLGKEAVDSMLDVSAGKEIEEKIRKIAQTQHIEMAELKTQRKGSIVTANLQVQLPSNLTVEEATNISNSLRDKLMKEIEHLAYVAIQIRSHQVETAFYKPALGRAFGWQRGARFKDKIGEAVGKGPGGSCVCPKCGYQTPHERGVPCSTVQCPNCKINLQRG